MNYFRQRTLLKYGNLVCLLRELTHESICGQPNTFDLLVITLFGYADSFMNESMNLCIATVYVYVCDTRKSYPDRFAKYSTK
jgi:hypothetical protein